MNGSPNFNNADFFEKISFPINSYKKLIDNFDIKEKFLNVFFFKMLDNKETTFEIQKKLVDYLLKNDTKNTLKTIELLLISNNNNLFFHEWNLNEHGFVRALLTDYKNILMANDFSYSTLINSIAKCDAKSIQRENKYINLNFMLENDFFKFLNPLFYYNYSNFLFLTDIVSEENNSFNDTNTKKHLMNNDIEYNSSKTTLLNDYILKKKNISNKQYIDNNNYLNRLSDKSFDNYNYQFISFFNYLKTHELNTRNKDNLIHFIKENNYQYADLKEYLNFYLDLFQLNYPIVFNKLNFMDNYNKINLKLDVVFNIKQSNKKLNKKINI